MDDIPQNPVLQFNPNTLQEVRRIHDLDNPDKIKETVDTLEQWVKEQPHFQNKDLSRQFLETTIISSKGSLQKSQRKLQNVCKWKVERPQFFGSFNVRTNFKEFDGVLSYGILPKLTKKHNRVWLMKISGDKFKSDLILQFARICIMISEYLRLHDYSDGVVIVVDLLEAKLLKLLDKLHPNDLYQAMRILIEGYGLRVKAIIILTSSIFFHILINLLKNVIHNELSSRIYFSKSVEVMHKVVPSSVLPVEYGGEEKSFASVHGPSMNVRSTTHQVYQYKLSYATRRTSYKARPDQGQTVTLDVPLTIHSYDLNLENNWQIEDWMKELSSEEFRRYLAEMGATQSDETQSSQLH